MACFKLVAPYKPTGDQPKAIDELVKGIRDGKKFQTLLGVTGSGKTFTIANVIERIGLPTLVISHNKTLAAQLYGELKSFFPENAVEYFISYYDYYQPEAYIPETDTYIEKDATINEDIERLRLRAATALVEREDVIVVASVSCIYSLGSPEDFLSLLVKIEEGEEVDRDAFMHQLVSIQYQRNDVEFKPGVFRVRGEVIDVFPPYSARPVRIEFFGDDVDSIWEFDALTGKKLLRKKRAVFYPAKQFVIPEGRLSRAIKEIEKELAQRVVELRKMGKELEAHRLEARTRYDIELLREVGYCPGIENYSRHISGRRPGERPWCLLDYFPEDFLVIIDESHVTIPQLRGMYNGDRSRKETLVEYGFRLPSALDNRPLKFDEFLRLIPRCIFVSATPGEWEIEQSGGEVVEQIVRPTGLLDPKIVVKPTEGQIDDLVNEIKKRVEMKERVLVTTLTKRMAEDLADYLLSIGIRARYLHSEIDALDRVDILRELRLGDFDVIVGINLLREGLDLPEVSLVAILEADKEGFLRSERSLIQIAGRAARNINGEVILYADRITDAMEKAIRETERRRKIQEEYNKRHGITPKTIKKTREEILKSTAVADEKERVEEDDVEIHSEIERLEKVEELTKLMRKYADAMEFEKAARIRDLIRRIMNEQIRERKGFTPSKRGS